MQIPDFLVLSPDRPTMPGWYWCDMPYLQQARPVLVFAEDGELWFWHDDWDEDSHLPGEIAKSLETANPKWLWGRAPIPTPPPTEQLGLFETPPKKAKKAGAASIGRHAHKTKRARPRAAATAK